MPGKITTTMQPSSPEDWTAHERVAQRLAEVSLAAAKEGDFTKSSVERIEKRGYQTVLSGNFATHSELERYNEDVASELVKVRAEATELRTFESNQPVDPDALPSVAGQHPMAGADLPVENSEQVALKV